ncbi:MAG: hypothetical protein NVSMB9_33680 [Isosphaeraceae bacterium]
MSRLLVTPVDVEGVAPREISPRLRSQLVYFQQAQGTPGVPPLREDELWFDPVEVARWIDDGVFFLVSPLDTANMTELELSEEQEDFLKWLQTHAVQRVRLST